MDKELPDEFLHETNTNDDKSQNEQFRPNTTDNSHIDDLTLELFMNKSMYNRYIEKTNPKKHQEQQEFLTKLNRYKHKILELTNTLVENPDKQITTDVNDIFNTYVKELVRYFEMKAIEMPSKNGKDGDTMFDPFSMDDETEHSDNSSTSYWGKEKVFRAGYLSR